MPESILALRNPLWFEPSNTKHLDGSTRKLSHERKELYAEVTAVLFSVTIIVHFDVELLHVFIVKPMSL